MSKPEIKEILSTYINEGLNLRKMNTPEPEKWLINTLKKLYPAKSLTHPDVIFYKMGSDIYLEYDLINKTLFVSSQLIYDVLKNDFDIDKNMNMTVSDFEVESLLKKVVGRIFNLEIDEIRGRFSDYQLGWHNITDWDNTINEGLNLQKQSDLSGKSPVRFFNHKFLIVRNGNDRYLVFKQPQIIDGREFYRQVSNERLKDIFARLSKRMGVDYRVIRSKFTKWEILNKQHDIPHPKVKNTDKKDYDPYETLMGDMNEAGLSDDLGNNDLPEVPKWGGKLNRGHANPIDYSTKWESGMSRGPANSLYEGLNLPKKRIPEDEFERWVDEYDPLYNNIEKNASFDGYMWETYDEELEVVLSYNNNQIWTIVEDDGDSFVIPGFYRINRIGYFITNKPWVDKDITINLSEGLNLKKKPKEEKQYFVTDQQIEEEYYIFTTHELINFAIELKDLNDPHIKIYDFNDAIDFLFLYHYDIEVYNGQDENINKTEINEGLNLRKQPKPEKTLPNEWIDQIVSDGTLNPDHLIPKYLSILNSYSWNNDMEHKIKELSDEYNRLGERDSDVHEHINDIYMDLEDIMQNVSPSGTWFGSSCGDGACLGFWSIYRKECPNCGSENINIKDDAGNAHCNDCEEDVELLNYD
jgi:hypothetical protein